MLKKFVTSTAALAMLTGAALANSGLTPGVPTGSDPITDSKQVVGERQ